MAQHCRLPRRSEDALGVGVDLVRAFEFAACLSAAVIDPQEVQPCDRRDSCILRRRSILVAQFVGQMIGGQDR